MEEGRERGKRKKLEKVGEKEGRRGRKKPWELTVEEK